MQNPAKFYQSFIIIPKGALTLDACIIVNSYLFWRILSEHSLFFFLLVNVHAFMTNHPMNPGYKAMLMPIYILSPAQERPLAFRILGLQIYLVTNLLCLK